MTKNKAEKTASVPDVVESVAVVTDVEVSTPLPKSEGDVHTPLVDLNSITSSLGWAKRGMCLVMRCAAVDGRALARRERITFRLETSDEAEFTNAVAMNVRRLPEMAAVDGTGSRGRVLQIELPKDAKQFMRLAATKSGPGDASGSLLRLQVKER
jgi:hypothetical protein